MTILRPPRWSHTFLRLCNDCLVVAKAVRVAREDHERFARLMETLGGEADGQAS